MIILGIDPGTARMGYGVLSFNPKTKKKELVVSDVIVTVPELEPHFRLKFLFKALNELCSYHKPDVMVIERLFFSSNVKTAMAVGQARGVSMLAAAMKNMPYFEYTAPEVKLVLTGYGRSDKKQMQEAVKKILKLSSIIKSDDANDAAAIALCYIYKELLPKEKAGF